MGAAREALRTLGQSLNLALWRHPESRPTFPGFGVFLLACALSLLAYFVQDWWLTASPAEAIVQNAHRHASFFLLVLAASWLAARVLGRAATWLPLATLVVLVGTAWTAIAMWVIYDWLSGESEVRRGAWHVLLATAGFIALWRMLGFVARDTAAPRRLGAALVLVAVLAAPWYWRQDAWFWFPPEEAESESVAQDDAPPPGESLDEDVDAEALLQSQPGRVQAALAALRPQVPGRVELFTLGFAGDGSERVFRNEVEYLERLAVRRLDAGGHALSLVNSPRTLARHPLATAGNLRTALQGLATRMDPTEDVLLLFLTSHGSEDHRLAVDLPPVPLRPLDPRLLREALDASGIRWRVVVVSACYSGGFVDALRDPHTLVITAARADRTSFGCGSDARITWFGRAFLAEGLNATADFEHAFALASRRIREWELRDGETPSVPQIAAGSAIGGKLAAWRAGFTPGAPLAFAPASPTAPGPTAPTSSNQRAAAPGAAAAGAASSSR
jgi:hypothetical protein